MAFHTVSGLCDSQLLPPGSLLYCRSAVLNCARFRCAAGVRGRDAGQLIGYA